MTKRKLILKYISELRQSRADALRVRVRRIPRPLYVLVACEESGVECAAYRDLGLEAYHCDVIPRQRGINKSWFINADVTPLLKGHPVRFMTADGIHRQVPRWDLVIAHPPCTYLSRVGSCHMVRDGRLNESRFRRMIDARLFFERCLRADAPYVAVENPVPLEMACLPTPTTYVDPSMFGDRFTKKTLYWLKNLPPLLPSIFHPFAKSLVASSRGKYRSRTSPYLAVAQSHQWVDVLCDDFDRGLLT